MSAEDPTADYRKYPKSPNFFLIVVLSGVVIVGFMVAALFVIHHKEKTFSPRNPTTAPNSLVQPLHEDPFAPRLS